MIKKSYQPGTLPLLGQFTGSTNLNYDNTIEAFGTVPEPINPWFLFRLALIVTGNIGNVTWQREHYTGKYVAYRKPYRSGKYSPENQYWQQAFREACQAWKALSNEEQQVYRDKAKGKQYYGCNLFISQFLKAYTPYNP